MMSDPSTPWDVLAVYRWKACRGSRRSSPKGAKGNEKKTTKQSRKPPPTQEPSDPRPQGDSGVVSVSQPPDRRRSTSRTAHSSTLVAAMQTRGLVLTIASAKPQLRRGRGRQRVRHPEPEQTRCQLTACFTCQPGVGRTSWALHLHEA